MCLCVKVLSESKWLLLPPKCFQCKHDSIHAAKDSGSSSSKKRENSHSLFPMHLKFDDSTLSTCHKSFVCVHGNRKPEPETTSKGNDAEVDFTGVSVARLRYLFTNREKTNQ